MPSASWLNGWLSGDVVTVGEFRKGVGAVYDTTLSVASASIDTGAVLPTTYAHMRIEIVGRGDTAALTTNLLLRFNNDSAANYDYQLASFSAATTTISETFAATSMAVGSIAANTAGASLAGYAVIDIANYAGTTFNKIAGCISGHKIGAATTNMNEYRIDGHWRSTAAINRITLLPTAGNFVTGTRVTIYVWGA